MKQIFPCDFLLNLARRPCVLVPIGTRAERYAKKLFGAPDVRAPEAGGRGGYTFPKSQAHALARCLAAHKFEVHFR